MRTLRLILQTTPKWISWLLVILDFIWELPQNIIGFLIALFFGFDSVSRETLNDGKALVFTWKLSKWNISLGWFQIVSKNASKTTVSHEVGHSHQSLYLGWLYLIFIGLPSNIWAGLIHKHTDKSYYWFYTERWADHCAGIAER